MEGIGALMLFSLLVWIVLAAVVSLALPVAYLWMLVDAIVRDVSNYPSRDTAEKVVWIVVMLVLQPAALIYFFLVWLPKRREQRSPGAAGAVAPVTPVAGTPVTGNPLS